MRPRTFALKVAKRPPCSSFNSRPRGYRLRRVAGQLQLQLRQLHSAGPGIDVSLAAAKNSEEVDLLASNQGGDP